MPSQESLFNGKGPGPGHGGPGHGGPGGKGRRFDEDPPVLHSIHKAQVNHHAPRTLTHYSRIFIPSTTSLLLFLSPPIYVVFLELSFFLLSFPLSSLAHSTSAHHLTTYITYQCIEQHLSGEKNSTFWSVLRNGGIQESRYVSTKVICFYSLFIYFFEVILFCFIRPSTCLSTLEITSGPTGGCGGRG